MELKKICRVCKIEKDKEELAKGWGLDKNGDFKYKNICRKCDNKRIDASRKARGKDREKYKIAYSNDPERFKKYYRKASLLNKYGLTTEDYNKMLDQQNGVCKICKQVCITNEVLSVDHCHTTGKIRGLLCMKCNSALGYFKDNIETLKSAIKYLENCE